MAGRLPYNATARSPMTMTPQRSPWHSPVPYLFGGLAAMLGLIAFALLILACSYWKLSGYLDGNDGNSSNEDRDLEAGEGDGAEKAPAPVFEEKILVIMAGQVKPTFLATPISSRSSSFGDTSSNNGSCVCGQKGDQKSVEMVAPLPEKNDQVTTTTTTTTSSSSSTESDHEHQTH
ncbi:protein GLUTAMINE DUMPER 5 [Humulus lupulus]|uniref:protein GLUTAMINE DUMPER 5 n=1 Tax=Humulus lupulus TaxID=3486 RepID=UPI002B4074D4|nr:protein GLUTAMINE DUMPER 5 [Humulus lupulus]